MRRGSRQVLPLLAGAALVGGQLAEAVPVHGCAHHDVSVHAGAPGSGSGAHRPERARFGSGPTDGGQHAHPTGPCCCPDLCVSASPSALPGRAALPALAPGGVLRETPEADPDRAGSPSPYLLPWPNPPPLLAA